MRLIDAENVIELMKEEIKELRSINDGKDHREAIATMLYAMSIVSTAETVEAEPVKRGRWVKSHNKNEDGFVHHMCSLCKTDAPFHYTYVNDYDEGLDGEWYYLGQVEDGIVEYMGNYCSNCGVKMDGE